MNAYTRKVDNTTITTSMGHQFLWKIEGLWLDLKVGNVFTRFGVGYGAGIDVGRPINLGNWSSSMFFDNTMQFGGIFKPKDGEKHDTSMLFFSTILYVLPFWNVGLFCYWILIASYVPWRSCTLN